MFCLKFQKIMSSFIYACSFFCTPLTFAITLTNLEETQQIIDGGSLELHIMPNLLSEEKLQTFRHWINTMMDYAYEDFDCRVGIVWDDYTLDISDFNNFGKSPTLLGIDPIKKFVTINEVKVEQHPQSIFNHPEISEILLKDILPFYFKAVTEHVKLPDSVYMQTFVLRSLLSEKLANQKQHVRWHQDPSDYGNSVADYTLVLMLSNPFDLKKGWDGGELLLKNGMPFDEAPAIRVTPKENQAVLFNNKLNSHLVTAINNAKDGTTRDVVIINIYLTDPSKEGDNGE